MDIQITDFNGAEQAFASTYREEWKELADAATDTPLHLKRSDQAGKIGFPIWDAVGTNAALKQRLIAHLWHANVPLPAAYSFLGTDVDFVKTGVLAEVQFSNYPFLLNNMLRSEFFFNSEVEFGDGPIGAAVIITKAKMFDASNSTLYYEQAQQQLTALATHSIFKVPLRLVGLFESYGSVPVVWTEYREPRYSRTILNQTEAVADISPGRRAASRAVIRIR